MKKRTRDETVDRFRIRSATAQGQALRARLETWASNQQVRNELEGAEPAMPDELEDRLMDAAEQLVAIADLAREDWSDRVRAALVAVSRAGALAGDGSRGSRLLGDLRDVTDAIDRDRYSMTELVDALNELPESEWSIWHKDAGFTPRDLGRLLKPYGIASQTVALGASRPKGYTADQLAEAFRRYLPAAGAIEPPAAGSNPVTGSPFNSTSPQDSSPLGSRRCLG
jgi:putative DNA primase/helicase